MVKERMILKNGDIIEFPLYPYEKIYGYVKFVDLNKGNPHREYHNPFRWLVYNYFSTNRIDNIEFLGDTEYLCNPLLMFWTANIKKLEGWKILHNTLVKPEEYIERYLRNIPNEFYEISPDKYSELTWICCLESQSDFNSADNWIELPYNNVRHLESTGSSLVSFLPCRVFLEKCKQSKVSVNVATLNENDWNVVYMSCLDIPAYNLIPKEYKQKPIPKDSNFKWPETSKLYFNYFDR